MNRRLFGVSVGVLAVCSLAAWQIAPAFANGWAGPRTQATADETAIQSAIPGGREAHAASTANDGALLTGTVARPFGPAGAADFSTFSIGRLASQGLTLGFAGGPAVQLGLPASQSAASGVRVSDGTVIYTDGTTGADTAVQALADGSARGYVIVNRPSAPTQYRFTFAIPSGTRFVYTAMGSSTGISLVDPHGALVARIGPAWAKAADGASIPSTYRIDGATIIQTVEHHGARYPVVADPWLSIGWLYGIPVSVTLHLSFVEVAGLWVSGYGAVYGVTDFLCSRIPWPFSSMCGWGQAAITAFIWAGVVWWAYNYFRCGLAITWHSTYRTYRLEC